MNGFERGLSVLMVRLNDVEQGALASLYAHIRNSCASSGIEYVPGDDRSLWHFFKTAEFWKDDLLLEPVLILDQFEDILTLQSEARRRDFIDPLSYLVRGVQPGSKDDEAPTLALSATPPNRPASAGRVDHRLNHHLRAARGPVTCRSPAETPAALARPPARCGRPRWRRVARRRAAPTASSASRRPHAG